ncbi:MAG: TonB-dependent receptor [Alteromonadaceae bacterium]|jgi:TonB-dependent receptor
MKKSNFKKTQLAKSLSIILGVTAITPVFAAEEVKTDNIEVIEVTGIRSSMVKAMDIKRSSQGIVDAINAEDIGKFPDSNLAESLQRITGVSIDRSNGEGSKVSVRGFSADRNLILLNGRQMPNTTGDRSFDFSNVAAEGVSSVEVYKTSMAKISTGGIGATINIKTNKPLANPGMHSVISVQALNDSSAQTGGTTPELSGLYSNTFADDTFGISLSASYSERESGNQQAGVSTGWRSYDPDGQDINGDNRFGPIENGKADQFNRTENADVYSVPQTTFYTFEEVQRERTNAQLVLQYSPVESITATLDYTYIQKEQDTQVANVSAWYASPGNAINVWTPGNVASPLLHSEVYDTPTDLAMGSGDYGIRDETTSLGFNVEWQVNDSLNLAYDYHDSDAENTPNNQYGSKNNLAARALIREASATDFTRDIPTLAVRGGNAVTASDMQVTGSSFDNEQDHSHIEQHQFNGVYVFEESGSIDFGIAMSTAENRDQRRTVQRNNWGGEGDAGSFGDDNFTRRTIQDQFDESGGNFSDFVDATGTDWSTDILNTYFEFDFLTVRQIAEDTLSIQPGIVGDCATSFCPSTDYALGTDQYTKEEMTSVYFQYNYEGEIGDMPFDVHVGVRYEETEVETTSNVPGFNATTWVGDTELPLTLSGGTEFQTKKGKYDHTLPSINFNLEVTDDIILRAAYSETIGRPNYGEMIGGTSLAGLARVNSPGGGNSGDAGLLPLEASNFDLSAEWYYGEGSYVSLGYFQKDITNESIRTESTYSQDNLRNPGALTSPFVQQAIDSGIDENDRPALRTWISDNITDPAVNVVGGNIEINGRSVDPLVQFNIASFANSTAKSGFDGVEFAVQHIFGETGFGTIVNYTLVNSDNSYDDASIGSSINENGINYDSDQVAETGISDTANVVGFYEKHGFSFRVAYNWRDAYLTSHFQGDVGASPVYVEAYSQVDLTVSYELPQVEGLNIFFNGINITDEKRRTHGRSSYEVLNYTQTGARFALGARYTF